MAVSGPDEDAQGAVGPEDHAGIIVKGQTLQDGKIVTCGNYRPGSQVLWGAVLTQVSRCLWSCFRVTVECREVQPSWLRFVFCFKDFIHLFLEIWKGREKKRRETLIPCLSHAPNWGPGWQSRRVP